MLKSVLLGLGLFCVLCEAAGGSKGAACPTLKLKLGRVRYRQKGRFVKFMCNTGFIIAGEKYSTCHNGTWDSPVPKCVRASCVKVNPPINGLIYPSHRGAVLNFFCKPGFELRGSNTTYCDGRSWDSNLPACIVSNTKPSLSCDFESEDLCGWNHDLRHDFDWIRMSHGTPSGHLGTGPSFDHTKGEEENGYYMYIESSSRNENDTARLISPIYDKMPDKDVCLEFYFHMHGASIGQLRVYLKKESESWVLEPRKALFWRSGNHGNQWLRSLTRIGPIDEDFQIVIEGVRGSSYFSDIAVDDVSIFENCTIKEDVTTESDVTYSDDFQTFESCLNRCDNSSYTVSPMNTFQYSCDCDDSCLDNNTCCPDYIAICVLGVADDFSTTELYNNNSTTAIERTTIQEEITEASATTQKPPTTMETPRVTTSAVPVRVYPKKNKTNEISNDINSVLPKSKQNPPYTKYNPANATDFKRAPQPYFPKVKKPTLVFLTPSTPEVIVQKVSVKPLTAFNPRTTTMLPLRKPAAPVTPEYPIDDILTVPQRTEDDKTYFTLAKLTTAQVKVIVEPGPSSIKTYGVQNQKIVKEKPQTDTKFIMVVVVSAVFILLVVLGGALLVRKYKVFECRKIKRHGTSSDSQSDVRFLTSDEMLDFNLACPDD